MPFHNLNIKNPAPLNKFFYKPAIRKCRAKKYFIAGEKICSGGKIPNVFAKMKNLKLLSISDVSEPPRFPPEYANKSARLKIKFIENDNGADSVEIQNVFNFNPSKF